VDSGGERRSDRIRTGLLAAKIIVEANGKRSERDRDFLPVGGDLDSMRAQYGNEEGGAPRESGKWRRRKAGAAI
jgi:hypothetical protein